MHRARLAGALEAVALTLLALILALGAWAAVARVAGVPVAYSLALLAQGSVGSWFALEQTLRAATPLLFTGLGVALAAQAGLLVIGAEGAFVIGGLAAAVLGAAVAGPLALPALVLGGAGAGALWLAGAGLLKHHRGVHEAVSTLLLTYLALAVTNALVEGVLRDPASIDKPLTRPIDPAAMIGEIGQSSLHWGLPLGLAACAVAYVVVSHGAFGLRLRILGASAATARFAGIGVGGTIVAACALCGALAGLAGAIEVAAVQHTASISLALGYGYVGILVAFIARGNMLMVVAAAILLGAIEASGGLLQRQAGAPASTAKMIEGLMLVALVLCNSLRGRLGPLVRRATARGGAGGA